MDQAAIDAFYDSLEQMGEHAVRRTLARGAWNPQRTKHAEDWLRSLEDRRAEVQGRKTLSIAKSANVAAWTAVVLTLIGICVTVAAWLLPRTQ